MNQLKKLTLFPNKWWEKKTVRELNKARAKLDNYSTSNSNKNGLREILEWPIKSTVVDSLLRGESFLLPRGGQTHTRQRLCCPEEDKPAPGEGHCRP